MELYIHSPNTSSGQGHLPTYLPTYLPSSSFPFIFISHYTLPTVTSVVDVTLLNNFHPFILLFHSLSVLYTFDLQAFFSSHCQHLQFLNEDY